MLAKAPHRRRAPAAEELPHLLAHALKRYRIVFARTTKRRINLAQLMLLEALADGAGHVKQGAAGHQAGMDRSTLSASLKGLAAKGLVEINGSDRDTRAKQVHLTDEGRKLLKDGRKAAAAATWEILKPFSFAVRRDLLSGLERLGG